MITKLPEYPQYSPSGLVQKVNEIIEKVNELEEIQKKHIENVDDSLRLILDKGEQFCQTQVKWFNEVSGLWTAVGELKGCQMADSWAKTYPNCPPEKED